MNEFNQEFVENLPDTYAKSKDSNNYKILNTVQEIMDTLHTDINDVFNSLDLEKSMGKTLDLYGETVGQARGLADDSKYRVMIKSRIMRNLMNGDYTSFMDAACLMFGCKQSEFYVKESEKVATVDVITLPFNVLNYIGLSAEETVRLLSVLVPAGIKVGEVDLTGTFEFSDSEDDFDDVKGFAISEENQTIGGYLGYMSNSTEKKPLPI